MSLETDMGLATSRTSERRTLKNVDGDEDEVLTLREYMSLEDSCRANLQFASQLILDLYSYKYYFIYVLSSRQAWNFREKDVQT